LRYFEDWDFRTGLADVRMAARTMRGEPSIAVYGPQSARVFASALPDATLVLVPDAGHYPQVEQPSAFFSAIDAFDRRVMVRR